MWFFYICASESQILYIVLFCCPLELCSIVKTFYTRTVTPALGWAHGSPIQRQTPTGNEDADTAISSRFGFWNLLNKEVSERGPFVPVKIFKHASQILYNKTKGGMDRNAQLLVIMRCSTDTLKWERKVVIKVFKSTAVNSWVAWRHLGEEELLDAKETFKELKQYRNSLNKFGSLTDFISEVTFRLLNYTEILDKQYDITPTFKPRREKRRRLKKQEVNKIISKAKGRMRYRLDFFNGVEGTALRLKLQGHYHRNGDVKYCALCGSNHNSRFRRHRSRTTCKLCHVHLCVKIHPGFSRSCWDVWHTVKNLRNRQPKAINENELNREDSENDSDDSWKKIQTRAQARAEDKSDDKSPKGS